MSKLQIGERGEMQKPYQMPNGTWRLKLNYRDLDGSMRPLTAVGNTAKQARLRLLEKWQLKADSLGHEGASDNETLDGLLQAWIDYEDTPRPNRRQLAENTRYKYRSAIDNDIVPLGGDWLLSEVTTGRLNALTDRLISPDGTGYTRAKRAKTVLASAWKWGIGQGMARGNPTRDMETVVSPKREVMILEEHELEIVRDAIELWSSPGGGRPGPKDTRVGDVFDLMLATGCRISEMLALDWNDVHLTAPKDADPQSFKPWVRIHRGVKEDPDGTLWIGPTKTEDIREFSMPKSGVEVLQRRAAEHGRRGLVFQAGVVRNGSPASKTGIVRPESVRRALRNALKYAEVSDSIIERAKPHSLRKTLGTLLERHLGIKAAARQLGHRNEKVTLQHYVATDKTIVDHADLIEDLTQRRREKADQHDAGPPVFMD